MPADVVERAVQPGDVARVAAAMRPADVAECALHGFTPIAALQYCVAVTPDATTVLVDGEPAAIYGATWVEQATLAPWLLATPALERAAVTVALRARRVVAGWAAQAPLWNACDTRNALAVTFLRWLGFAIHPSPGPLALFSMEVR